MSTKTVSPGICRFDFDDRKIHGYMVRITRRKKNYQEFFGDRRYGGKRKAKKAAKERLEELKETLPSRATVKGRMTERNSSGIVGVHLARDVDYGRTEKEYFSYVASWTEEDGSRVNVKFGWLKYGEDTAWDLACIAREKMTRDRDRIMKLYRRRQKRKSKK